MRAKKPPVDKEVRRLQEALARLANSDDGLIVLRWIFARTGFAMASIVMDESKGEINTLATIYNEARRNFWLDFKLLMKVEDLIKIEYPLGKKDKPNEREQSTGNDEQ